MTECIWEADIWEDGIWEGCYEQPAPWRPAGALPHPRKIPYTIRARIEGILRKRRTYAHTLHGTAARQAGVSAALGGLLARPVWASGALSGTSARAINARTHIIGTSAREIETFAILNGVADAKYRKALELLLLEDADLEPMALLLSERRT
ncbi:MAG: hypothetical protein KAJ03_09390 [Gammaproteobacteria bacterium]|nr:hypothetical protein [Gammaproteobacteria bacterium]